MTSQEHELVWRMVGSILDDAPPDLKIIFERFQKLETYSPLFLREVNKLTRILNENIVEANRTRRIAISSPVSAQYAVMTAALNFSQYGADTDRYQWWLLNRIENYHLRKQLKTLVNPQNISKLEIVKTRELARILRINIFGYCGPFKRDWINDRIRMIAWNMKRDGDWSLLPILADAIEEAGCVDETILIYMRTEKYLNQLVKHCWIVDFILY